MRQVSYLNKAFSPQARIIPNLPENHVGRCAKKPQYKQFSAAIQAVFKQALFALKRSLVYNAKKPCLQHKQDFF